MAEACLRTEHARADLYFYSARRYGKHFFDMACSMPGLHRFSSDGCIWTTDRESHINITRNSDGPEGALYPHMHIHISLYDPHVVLG